MWDVTIIHTYLDRSALISIIRLSPLVKKKIYFGFHARIFHPHGLVVGVDPIRHKLIVISL